MTEVKEEKKSAISTFREKVSAKSDMSTVLGDGLKSTNAKVRALAAKIALRTQDKNFIKKSVLPLIASDKSKKVLRVVAKRITRKPLVEKLLTLTVKKQAGKKIEKAEAPAGAPPKAS